MTKRMLIDASHPEETRVVVLDGNRLEEFDLETAHRRPLKGNIYLAKVVRVEPSLQAAFVEYGGNRHGFLAFSEIHPDYYQIPVADRQRLLEMQAAEAREEAEAEEEELRAEAAAAGPEPQRARRRPAPATAEPATAEAGDDEAAAADIAARVTAAAAEAGGIAAASAGAAERAERAGPDEDLAAGSPPPGDEAAEQAAARAVPWRPTEPLPTTPPEAPGADDAGTTVRVTAAPRPDEPVAKDARAVPTLAPAEGAADTAAAGEAEGTAPPRSGPAMPMTRAVERISGAPPADPEDGAAAPDAADSGEDHIPPAGVIETVTLAGAARGAEAPEAALPQAAAGAEPPAASGDAALFPAAAPVTEADPGEEDRLAGPRAEAAAPERLRTPREEPDGDAEPPPPPETLGGEGEAAEAEEVRRERRIPPKFLRHYKIQEVIKRRQIMLVQVVKEERGSKGAALTTYISLAGRFSVLMPNSPRGGGISRKITSAADRKRLREVIDELGLPEGMSLIIRTAGANRPKAEIKRDCEYLLRLWDSIRERTLQSTAPALIYEEADLIKRSIRDVYGRDVDEIIVEGEDAYREAREFMRMLMPSHVRKIQLHRDPVPLFVRYGVEQQLEAMLSPVVQLRSGGYLVINQTEALVSIDVNSGRATRDRHIEDTALKVNLEAADEIARQLRLRDLAGLIVIDFIDMESAKHDAMVERRLKEALKHDRARIQVGRISHFGLLEMSRQRLRPSLAEHAFVTCPHCQGRGQVRSIESSAIAVLRAIEEEGAKRRAAEILVRVAQPVALFLLNRRRDRLAAIEARHGMQVVFEPDDSLVPPSLRIERVRPQTAPAGAAEAAPSAALRMDYAPEPEEPEEEAEAPEEEAAIAAEAPEEAAAPAAGAGRGETPAPGAGEAEGEAARRRRRRRRRRPGRREEGGAPLPGERAAGEAASEPADEREEYEEEEEESAAAGAGEPPPLAAGEIEGEEDGEPGEAGDRDEEQRAAARRRRGRRGGRRRRAEPEREAVARSWTEAEQLAAAVAGPAAPPAPAAAPATRYAGPTPADPFAGHIDDIYEAMAAAEAAAEAAAAARGLSPSPGAALRAAPLAAGTGAQPALGSGAGTAPVPHLVAAALGSDRAAAEAPPAEATAAAGAAMPEAPTGPAAGAAAPGAEAVAPAASVEPQPTPQEPRIGPPVQPRLIDLEPEAEALPKRRGYWRR
ncbi:hypothetical protein GCM10010964_13940 [Caldovatus sediminis]|uniref:Ribonuclease E n=1 Tax=Caldovatus sediminis TaxID=2041189 RepID=A0A8J2Z9H1_9PROT|nr:ribonuclease E/G [Caldovatus sediminis]GGG27228.1 hypothetical protein GCM10010964_13940 [Caldovatus sediminis]